MHGRCLGVCSPWTDQRKQLCLRGGWVGGHKQNSRNEILEDEGFIPLRSLTRAPLPACPGAGEAFCYPQITVNRHQVAILND